MKKYIFVTTDIHSLGGIQIYVSGKSKFLEKNGWNVYVIYPSFSKESCVFPFLDKYQNGRNANLSFYPGELPKKALSNTISWMKQVIDFSPNDEVLIESHHDRSAAWAEIFAQELKGIHACLCCNEVFRGKNKHYIEYIDLFKYKYDRKQLAGISENSMKMMFENTKYEALVNKPYVFDAAPDETVQDVKNIKISEIEENRINIAYIGRVNKDFFKEISISVKTFVTKYQNQKFNYIIVGDAEKENIKWISTTFKSLDNIKITFTGSLSPVPRELFNKLDVSIAGSGCALMSAGEGVLTILVDANDGRSDGVLGIDTSDFLYRKKDAFNTTVEQSLEDIIVLHKYKASDIKMPEEPDTAEIFKQHFEYFENKTKEYYSKQLIINAYKKNLKRVLRYLYVTLIKDKIYYIK